jgi:hypothetical protein
VEIDWALYKPHLNRIGSNLCPDDQRICRSWCDVIPEMKVYSVGRTSGFQKGIINSSMSYVDFGDHQTRQWAVIKHPDSSGDLVKSGIGVEGDSGASVIDMESSKLYGMLWGRHGEGLETVTYFMPMVKIVADIKEKLGEVEIRLP